MEIPLRPVGGRVWEVTVRHRLLFAFSLALVAAQLATPVAHAGGQTGTVAPTGFFVVGDLSANLGTVGTRVQFWGAQWSKNNSLSGGQAPAAFKGFTDGANDPTCPTSWSTDPGNSTPPPATVSSVITVIVSSSIVKSGSVISGNVVELVTVNPDPGYQGDPGHAGFGTVTGVVTCGLPV
jgi:hypothetical protein